MAQSRILVADAWNCGERKIGANISTDGHDVLSYGHHRIGETAPNGRKIAYDCHYSVTTAKHCSALKSVADAVIPCKSCGYNAEDRARRESAWDAYRNKAYTV